MTTKRRGKGESRTSVRRLKAAEKQRQAMELRAAGADFATIASRLGYAGPSGAYKAVQEGLLVSLREPADELRELELTRLDKLLLGTWELACSGDPQAVAAALKIMERRARLTGLDAPERVQVEGEGVDPMAGMSEAELRALAFGKEKTP